MKNIVKYHISPMSGEPRRCMAGKRQCPVGIDAPHFNTVEEAYDYIRSKNNYPITKTFKKSNEQVHHDQYTTTNNDKYGVKSYAYKEIEKFAHGTVYTDGERYYNFIRMDGRKYVNINDNLIPHQDAPLIHKNKLNEPRYIKLYDANLSNDEQFSENNYVPITVQKFGAAMRLAEAYPVGTIFKKDGFQYRVVHNSGENMQVIRELNYDNNETSVYPSSELLDGAEIIHKPDIMSARHTEFREKYSPGTVMDIKRQSAGSEKKTERNLKTFFGLKKDDKLSTDYAKTMRVRVMDNDGTFIKFRDLDTNKVSELLRDDFNKKYANNGELHTQPYLNPYELKQNLAGQLKKQELYDLYDDNGNKTVVKVKELKYNSVVFSYTKAYHSVPTDMEISNRDLTNGEYSFTRHMDEKAPTESVAPNSGANLPYGNIYSGNYDNKLTDPMAQLQSDDYVTIVDSQGFIFSTSAKVIVNDGREVILEDFSKGNKISLSEDAIKNSRFSVLKL